MGLLNLRFVAGQPVLIWLLGIAGLALLALMTVGVVACSRLARGLQRLLARYVPMQIVTRVAQSIAAFRDRPGALLKAVGVSLVGHVALVATFVALGRFLMPALPSRLVSLLALFGLFANAVPLTPGGLGVGEAAFETLFRIAGAGGGAGLLLAWRIGMMPLVLIGGLLYVAGVRHPRPGVDERSADAAAALP
jgi:uncharacterized membrane protein YbhN (UPF0104 family)